MGAIVSDNVTKRDHAGEAGRRWLTAFRIEVDPVDAAEPFDAGTKLAALTR